MYWGGGREIESGGCGSRGGPESTHGDLSETVGERDAMEIESWWRSEAVNKGGCSSSSLTRTDELEQNLGDAVNQPKEEEKHDELIDLVWTGGVNMIGPSPRKGNGAHARSVRGATILGIIRVVEVEDLAKDDSPRTPERSGVENWLDPALNDVIPVMRKDGQPCPPRECRFCTRVSTWTLRLSWTWPQTIWIIPIATAGSMSICVWMSSHQPSVDHSVSQRSADPRGRRGTTKRAC